jgi:hypothetical protein
VRPIAPRRGLGTARSGIRRHGGWSLTPSGVRPVIAWVDLRRRLVSLALVASWALVAGFSAYGNAGTPSGWKRHVLPGSDFSMALPPTWVRAQAGANHLSYISHAPLAAVVIGRVSTAKSLQSVLRANWQQILTDPQFPVQNVVAQELSLPVGSALMLTWTTPTTTTGPAIRNRMYVLIQDGFAYLIVSDSVTSIEAQTDIILSAESVRFTKSGKSTAPAIPAWLKDLKTTPKPSPKGPFIA